MRTCAAALHSYLDGVKIDDDQLAVEAFAEVGPGNHFFGCSHTMAHYETAFWDSDLSDNEPFEKWEAAGSHDAAYRANQLWKKRLAEFEAPALDAGMRAGVDGVCRGARRRGWGMPGIEVPTRDQKIYGVISGLIWVR